MLERMTKVVVVASLAGWVGACGDVKQQQPPRVPDDTGSAETGDDADDMGSDDAGTITPAADTGPKETEAERRKRCCQLCVAGAAEDTSGDPPGALNCTKLAAKDTGCVMYFDKNPTTGGEAETCAAEGGEGEGEDAE